MRTKYCYIMGSASGAGKTTLCEGLLLQCLRKGYQAEQLAYIKPMTQCTDKQAVTDFCESKKIAHQGISGLVFKTGFSKDFISGLTRDSTQILQDILAEIRQLSKNKAIVVIDGIGSPSTGSVIGVSNVDIALLLAAPVLFVGKAGIGAAIDDTVLAVNFMQQGGIKNIALIYNKIEHSELANVKYYVTKRLAVLLPQIPVLDFIANHTPLDTLSKQQSAANISQWFLKDLFIRN